MHFILIAWKLSLKINKYILHRLTSIPLIVPNTRTCFPMGTTILLPSTLSNFIKEVLWLTGILLIILYWNFASVANCKSPLLCCFKTPKFSHTPPTLFLNCSSIFPVSPTTLTRQGHWISLKNVNSFVKSWCSYVMQMLTTPFSVGGCTSTCKLGNVMVLHTTNAREKSVVTVSFMSI